MYEFPSEQKWSHLILKTFNSKSRNRIKMPPSNHYPCDVLVIGAGFAGLRVELKLMMLVHMLLLLARIEKEILTLDC